MSAKDIVIIKDEENDVIYVKLAGMEKALTSNQCLTPDITIHKNYNTNQIVGLTIEDFSKNLPDLSSLDQYLLMEKFDAILEMLNAPNLIRSIS